MIKYIILNFLTVSSINFEHPLVQKITPSSLSSIETSNSHPSTVASLVLFYSSQCKHCHVIKAGVERLALELEHYQPRIRIFSVDCWGTDVCQRRPYLISGYPTFLLVRKSGDIVVVDPEDSDTVFEEIFEHLGEELGDVLPDLKINRLLNSVETEAKIKEIYRPEYFSEADFRFAGYRILTSEIYREIIRNKEILTIMHLVRCLHEVTNYESLKQVYRWLEGEFASGADLRKADLVLHVVNLGVKTDLLSIGFGTLKREITSYDYCEGFGCGVWTLFHVFSVTKSDYITNIDLLTLLLDYRQGVLK